MVEEEYVSIQEAARRCGVCGKTIQRAIQAGKLPAQYPKPNRCEIAISDLKTFRPGQMSGHSPNPAALESRIVALERRLAKVEGQLEQVRNAKPDVQLETTSRTGTTQPRASRSRPFIADTPLPEGLVFLHTFASLHAVSSNEAERRWKAGFIQIVKQPPAGGKRHQTIALDEQGRRDFWVQLHATPGFRSCDQCPHITPRQTSGP